MNIRFNVSGSSVVYKRLVVGKHSMRVGSYDLIDYASDPAFSWAEGETFEHVTRWLKKHKMSYQVFGWRDRAGDFNIRSE